MTPGRHRRLDFDFPEYRSSLLLMFLTHRGNSPYFVLLALPVLQAAYRFHLPTCISVIVVADSMTFFWVWRFAEFQPPNLCKRVP